MKKRTFAVLVILLLTLFFSSCSYLQTDEQDANNYTDVSSLVQVRTDEARIKDNEAIELIKSFSNEQLGLDDEIAEQCSFMVQNDGSVIDGENYVKVVAAIKIINQNDTYNFDIKGEYYISFSGDIVLKKSDNTFVELER